MDFVPMLEQKLTGRRRFIIRRTDEYVVHRARLGMFNGTVDLVLIAPTRCDGEYWILVYSSLVASSPEASLPTSRSPRSRGTSAEFLQVGWMVWGRTPIVGKMTEI